MTSNLGSDRILSGITEDGEISESAKEQVRALLRQNFRPEFLNRMDEIVFYKPLTKENIRGIVELLLTDLAKRLSDRRLILSVTEAAKVYIADAGYDPVYGARPLKRFLQSQLETKIARKILSDDPAPDSVLSVDFDGKALTVN